MNDAFSIDPDELSDIVDGPGALRRQVDPAR